MSKPKRVGKLITVKEKEYIKTDKGKSFEVSQTSLFLWKNCNGTRDKDELTKLLINAHNITSVSSTDVEQFVSSSLKDLNKKGLVELG